MPKKRSFSIRRIYGYLCLGLLLAGMLLLFQSLYLHGSDDRIYSTIGHASFADYLYFMQYHYSYCNGRTWIHSLLILCLRFGVYAWRILMPVVFACTAFCAALLTGGDPKRQSALALACGAFLCIPSVVCDDTLFWESGSFNYILPVPLIFLLFLLLRGEKHLWLALPLGLLCGASMEQYGMITLGGLLLWTLWRVFAEKNKARLGWFLAAFAAVLGGLLTLVFSPSVHARSYAESSSLTEKASFLLFNYWFHSKRMCVFLVCMALAACLYLLLSAKTVVQKLLAVLPALGVSAAAALSFLSVPFVSTLCTLGFPALLACICLYAAIHAVRRRHVLPLIALILAGGAQVMMLATQRYSFRTTFPSLMCLIVFTLSLLLRVEYDLSSRKLTGFLRVTASVCLVLVCLWNQKSCWQFARQEHADYLAGAAYTESFVDTPQTRADVDAVIEEFESVRQEQIELHAQQSAAAA